MKGIAMRRTAQAVLLAVCLAAPLLGQTTTGPDAMTPAEKAREYVRLNRELADLFARKDYAAAAGVCGRMIELAPRQAAPHYNLACCAARMGDTEKALAELERAIAVGFSDAGHLGQDEDLAGLRELPRFKQMLADLARGEKEAADRLYEKGPPVPGVKTIEGSPEGGLRWRLHMNPGPTTRPDRLIIWLHPSGGSMNGTVEPLATEFVKRGYALLVPTAKDWRGWSDVDSRKLLDRTLPDVAKVKGVNVDRPILFGFSAGGQLAIILWRQSPEKYGGLVLDAAYPVVPDATKGGYALLSPPASPAVKDCPFFVLVGDQDGGANAWRLAEEPFSKAGVPVVVHYIPGQGHAWLFGGAQRDKLYAWLSDIAAGRKPGEPVESPPGNAPTTRPDRGPIRLKDVY